MITGVFAFIISLVLFYKLPKSGSGVYLLCGTSVLSIIYLIIAFRRKNTEILTEINNISAEIEEE